MSNFIDKSELTELLLASDDDYEPYGMATWDTEYNFTDSTGYIKSQVPLHNTIDMDYWLGE